MVTRKRLWVAVAVTALLMLLVLLVPGLRRDRGPLAAPEFETRQSSDLLELGAPPEGTSAEDARSPSPDEASAAAKAVKAGTGSLLLRIQGTREQLEGLRLELKPFRLELKRSKNPDQVESSFDPATGEWLWSGLTPGSYRWRRASMHALQVVPRNTEADATFSADGTVRPGSGFPLDSGLIEVAAGRVTEIVVPLLPSVGLRGRVVFPGVAPTDIDVQLKLIEPQINPYTGKTGYATQSDEARVSLAPDGSFHLPWAPVGRRNLIAKHAVAGRMAFVVRKFELVEGQDCNLGLIEPSAHVLTIRLRLVDPQGKPFDATALLGPDERIEYMRPSMYLATHGKIIDLDEWVEADQIVVQGLEPHGPGTEYPLNNLALSCEWDIKINCGIEWQGRIYREIRDPKWRVISRYFNWKDKIPSVLDVDIVAYPIEQREVSFDPKTFFSGRSVAYLSTQRLAPRPGYSEQGEVHNGPTLNRNKGVESLHLTYTMPGPVMVYAYSSPDENGERLCALFELNGEKGFQPPPAFTPSGKLMLAIQPGAKNLREVQLRVITRHGATELAWNRKIEAQDDNPIEIGGIPPGASVFVGDQELQLGGATQVVPSQSGGSYKQPLAEPK